MPRQILGNIIQNFNVDRFADFFRAKTEQWGNFRPADEAFTRHDDGNFQKVKKLGQIEFENNSLVIICAESSLPLSERSGKKYQYDKAKGILKELDVYSAGIFIYYYPDGNFRFSLIYPEYYGSKRKWSNFRRFTYFVSKKLTNKTFLQRIGDGDFSGLEKIKEAFSVERVTKDFYKEIAYWYFWACKVTQPPEGSARRENGKEMFIIRLITRIVFVWFMRQKDSLLPDILFERDKLEEILKDLSPDNATYYKAILQNLFFATLSMEINNRKFRSEFRSTRGWNKDFGNQYVYRYYDLFQKPEMIESYFEQIPFLNGGLFECLDDKDNNDYIDGFTERKKYQPTIPNYLFFGNERVVDLNSDFGTRNKSYKIRGLIDILSSFNFTIDENTPDDQDVALDPELLGRVFENLLASFNPETSTTARKATGSYYTPREIVDYMVTESLKAYFKTHLEDIEKFDEKLEKLFSIDSDKNPFTKTESKKLVDLIESVRVVDPAVGSGAFPMGALNKMVFILKKIDPGNELWKQAQLAAAETIPDPQVRRNTTKQIEEFFKDKNEDYGRKLYLIQKCIYGVDIQQIAVEIAKLRFFISLLVDEKIDDQKENHGIKPLPNLDFKLMCGNSLVEYGSPDLIVKGADEVKNKLIDSYFERKEKYFFTSDHKIKNGLFEDINNIIVQLANYDYQKQYDDENKRLEGFKAQGKLFGTLPGENMTFEDNRPEVLRASKKLKSVEDGLIKPGKDHFEWHLNFNEVFEKSGGFDVVIANPPYVQLQKDGGKLANLYKNCGYQTFERTGDIYSLFYEKGITLLKNDAVLTFITSNKWMRAGYGKSLRKYFNAYNPRLLIDLGPGIFESATVDTNILIIEKRKNQGQLAGLTLNAEARDADLSDFISNNKKILPKMGDDAWFIGSDAEQKLKEKIERIGKPLKEWDVNIYYGIKTGLNEAFIINTATRDRLVAEDPKTAEILKPILRGRDIKRYGYEWAGLWLIATFPALKLNIDDYPAVKKYLFNFGKERLEQAGNRLQDGTTSRKKTGNKWFETQDQIAYYHEFEKEKVVYPDIMRMPRNDFSLSNYPFICYDDDGYFVEATNFFITGQNIKYVFAYLTSKLGVYSFVTHYSGPRFDDKGLRYKKVYLENLPIPPITPSNKGIVEKIERIVEEILSAKKKNPAADTSQPEREIDQMVYKLYGLTPEEIAVVEEVNKNN